MESELLDLLRERERIIADHAWRDRDAAEHLDALRCVSQEIATWEATHRASLDPRMRHFLDNASFAKARALLEAAQSG